MYGSSCTHLRYPPVLDLPPGPELPLGNIRIDLARCGDEPALMFPLVLRGGMFHSVPPPIPTFPPKDVLLHVMLAI